MSKQPNEAHHEARAATPPDPDYGAAVAAARPKVKELLEEYRADPTGDAAAIVETLVLNQVAGESAREAEVLHSQPDRDLSHTLVGDAGRSGIRLTRQNGRLKRDLARKNMAQAYVRMYLEDLGAAMRSGKEPTTQEIIEKISTAIGLRGPLIERVETEPPPDFSRVRS